MTKITFLVVLHHFYLLILTSIIGNSHWASNFWGPRAISNECIASLKILITDEYLVPMHRCLGTPLLLVVNLEDKSVWVGNLYELPACIQNDTRSSYRVGGTRRQLVAPAPNIPFGRSFAWTLLHNAPSTSFSCPRARRAGNKLRTKLPSELLGLLDSRQPVALAVPEGQLAASLCASFRWEQVQFVSTIDWSIDGLARPLAAPPPLQLLIPNNLLLGSLAEQSVDYNAVSHSIASVVCYASLRSPLPSPIRSLSNSTIQLLFIDWVQPQLVKLEA